MYSLFSTPKCMTRSRSIRRRLPQWGQEFGRDQGRNVVLLEAEQDRHFRRFQPRWQSVAVEQIRVDPLFAQSRSIRDWN
jgi:hypothetical protein